VQSKLSTCSTTGSRSVQWNLGGVLKTLKRDYVQVKPLPDAHSVLRLICVWIEDYNDNHSH